MTDRELLELAAKACGLYREWKEPDYEVQWNGNGLWCSGMGKGLLWNPLDDDGDALRLAVKLGMEVYIDTHPDGCECTEAYSVTYGISNGRSIVNHNGDVYSATRRAIVRCAAEIGRNMK
jgi:hypothetical protein